MKIKDTIERMLGYASLILMVMFFTGLIASCFILESKQKEENKLYKYFIINNQKYNIDDVTIIKNERVIIVSDNITYISSNYSIKDSVIELR